MTYHLQTWCFACQRPFSLKPFAGNFFWCCECPPPQTWTTNNTVPVEPERKPK